METAREHRNAARWTVAFTLGLRQGEALGLRWADVDLDQGVLHVRQAIGRIKGRGLVLGPVKSKSGVRTITLPKPMLADQPMAFVNDGSLLPKSPKRWPVQASALT